MHVQREERPPSGVDQRSVVAVDLVGVVEAVVRVGARELVPADVEVAVDLKVAELERNLVERDLIAA